MSCGELFQVYSTRAVTPPAMPVDLAMRLCLGHSPPIRKLLNSYEELRGSRGRKPLRSCLNLKQSTDHEPEWRESTKSSKSQKKKRVVFADMKGLSLTAVRFFSKIEEDLCDLQHALSDLTCFRPRLRGSHSEVCRYVLDFPQPSADYATFRSRLLSNLVCLESCLIQDHALSGTVKVRNIEYEKKVLVRITFDGWKSFRDVSCQYMHSTYGSADMDTFSFELSLPKPSSSCKATEFCISFRCGQKTHWDNNQGKNYKIYHVGVTRSPSHAVKSAKGAREHLGTSRAAALVLSHLQSWRHSEPQAPYWLTPCPLAAGRDCIWREFSPEPTLQLVLVSCRPVLPGHPLRGLQCCALTFDCSPCPVLVACECLVYQEANALFGELSRDTGFI